MTETEVMLWSRLRRKQILNIQFCRQKPIGRYIVDFYAKAGSLSLKLMAVSIMSRQPRQMMM